MKTINSTPIITVLCQQPKDTNKHVRVFISQPMRDKSYTEIQQKRKTIETTLTKLGFESFEIIDSVFKDSPASPLYLLGESLKLLSDADVVYFANGWDGTRGCKMEYSAWESYLHSQGVLCYTEHMNAYGDILLMSKHQTTPMESN